MSEQRTQFLNGPESIEILFNATLQNKEKMLRTALADKPLVYLVGVVFADEYISKRKDSSIFLRSLRFTADDVDKTQHKDYEGLHKEVRTAPGDLGLSSSFVIWDDNIAVVNTENEIEIIWIRDKDYAESIKAWYDFIWEKSL